MTVTLNKRRVETPQRIYENARVELGEASVRVIDKRLRNTVYEAWDVAAVNTGGQTWTVGEDVTMEQMKNCGCGGTIVAEK